VKKSTPIEKPLRLGFMEKSIFSYKKPHLWNNFC